MECREAKRYGPLSLDGHDAFVPDMPGRQTGKLAAEVLHLADAVLQPLVDLSDGLGEVVRGGIEELAYTGEGNPEPTSALMRTRSTAARAP